MGDTSAVNSGSTLKRLFYRPPYIGLLAFVIVFFVQAIGHTVMIMMQKLFGEQYVYQSAAFLGLVGAVMLLIGMRNKSEVAAKGNEVQFFPLLPAPSGYVDRKTEPGL